MAIDISQGVYRYILAKAGDTANRVATFPDVSDTVVMLTAAQAISGKTYSAPVFSSPISTTAFGGNQAIAAGGTITLPAAGESDCIQLNPAAAVAGVIMTAGTLAGQQVTLLNIAAAANTVTFAVVGTSRVANGVACVIRGKEACIMRWSTGQGNWFPVNR